MRIQSLILSTLALAVCPVLACTDDGGGGSGEETSSGDGDGDPGDGDGDTGDGDGDTGDGDGDTGDGDGDTGDGDGDGDPECMVDEAAILAEAQGYQGWTLINTMPFLSAGHDMGMATVNIWVPPELADQYKAIDPAAPQATTFPPCSIIVKEHVDDQGQPAAATIMFKGPPGYSMVSGDWWWGMGDLLGGNLVATGPDLDVCIGCHSAVSTTDWLFGISADNQNP